MRRLRTIWLGLTGRGSRSVSSFKSLSQFDYHERLAKTGGVSVVMFSSRACGSCRHWHNLLQKDRLLPGVTLLTVDAGEELALTRALEVFHLPTLLVYVDGLYHGPLQAEAAPEAIQQALAYLLAHPAQEEP